MTRYRTIFSRLLATRAAWPVVIALLLLVVTGYLALRVSSPERANAQHMHLLFGLLVLLVTMLPNYERIGQFAYAFTAGVGLLLVMVLFTASIKGSRRWFSGPFGFQIQPSELAKISFVLTLSWYLRYRKDLRTLPGLVVPFALMIGHAGLIALEPDLGTALLFPITLYAMLIAAGAKIRHLAGIAIVAAVLAVPSYSILPSYARQRIDTMWLHVSGHVKESALRDQDYQAHQSKICIGSGGWFGQGLDGAEQVRKGLLPEAYNDFIFAVIGTQWGLMGCVLVLAMYLAFFAAGLEISASTKEPFGRLMVVGLVSMIIAQAFINIAMTIGLCPVVGIALPFLSYGGSSLVTNLLAVGLLLNVSVRRTAKMAPPAFEYAFA